MKMGLMRMARGMGLVSGWMGSGGGGTCAQSLSNGLACTTLLHQTWSGVLVSRHLPPNFFVCSRRLLNTQSDALFPPPPPPPPAPRTDRHPGMRTMRVLVLMLVMQACDAQQRTSIRPTPTADADVEAMRRANGSVGHATSAVSSAGPAAHTVGGGGVAPEKARAPAPMAAEVEASSATPRSSWVVAKDSVRMSGSNGPLPTAAMVTGARGGGGDGGGGGGGGGSGGGGGGDARFNPPGSEKCYGNAQLGTICLCGGLLNPGCACADGYSGESSSPPCFYL